MNPDSQSRPDQSIKADHVPSDDSPGTAKLSVHRRLPNDDPIHNLVGRVANDWALVEHQLDLIIWELAKVDYETGACLTGQIHGALPKLTAIKALCKRRKLEEIFEQVKELEGRCHQVQNRRNRILHDPWYIEEASQQSEQFKSMARGEWQFGHHPVDEKFLIETLEKIDRRIEEVGKLRNAINEALNPPDSSIAASDSQE